MAKTAAQKKAEKDAKAAAAAAVGGTMPTDASAHEEVNTSTKADKKGNSIVATGKCEVVEFSSGQFRLFNENGQAVSPVVSREDTMENGKSALSKLQRDCARMNALQKSRTVRTPVGHAVQ